MAAFEGFNQRIPSAIFLGTLGVVCTFMVYMPKLEVFKVWGVEARLNRTLDRAEEILGKLQHLSVISAKATYMTFAWSNRFGSPGAKAKQAILDDVDRQLDELKVTPTERAEIVRPYMTLIGWDFFQLYVTTVENYMQAKYSDVTHKLNIEAESAEARATIDRWAPLIAAWRTRWRVDGLYQQMLQTSFAEFLNQAVPPEGLLDKNEMERVNKYRAEILALYNECLAKGGYTDRAAQYYDNYNPEFGGDKKKIKELFGYEMKY
ncbi:MULTISPECIES: hypothetical protein [Bradyrhizobium]|nr:MULTISPECIES: hypothetical protein [Bradyrhizobium]